MCPKECNPGVSYIEKGRIVSIDSPTDAWYNTPVRRYKKPPMKRQDYGFRLARRMAEGDFRERRIAPEASRFVTTGDFMEEAKNHCAAVCATNLLDIVQQKLVPEWEKEEVGALFLRVHESMGDGPVFFFDRRLRRFFRKDFGLRHHLTMESWKVRRFEEMKEALDAGLPCVLLLANDLFHWHWVLAVGYREYVSDPAEAGKEAKGFLRLADSWQRTADTFYRIGDGSRLLSARVYRFLPQGGSR